MKHTQANIPRGSAAARQTIPAMTFNARVRSSLTKTISDPPPVASAIQQRCDGGVAAFTFVRHAIIQSKTKCRSSSETEYAQSYNDTQVRRSKIPDVRIRFRACRPPQRHLTSRP